MKTASQILIAALVAGSLGACAPSPQERLVRAEKALNAHRYSEARLDYLSVIRDNPANRTAQLALVRVYLAQENPTSAVELLDQIAKKRPLSREARLLRGESYVMLGRFDDARAAVTNDKSAEAWRIRAIAHVGRGETEQAALAFGNGQRASGAKSRLLADFAHFRMGQNDLAGAYALARQAERADPGNLNAMLVNGDIAMSTKRFRQALNSYSRAARTYPENRTALFGRIAALAELKRFGELRKLVDAARVASPQDTELLYFDARLAADSRDWEKSRALLQPYETSLDTMPAANTLYAEVLMRLGQAEQARTRLSSQLLREPENRRARVLLGEVKLAVMDPEGALETLAPVAGWPDASAQELALLAEAEARASGG